MDDRETRSEYTTTYVHQLESDLKHAKKQLDLLLQKTPDFESLHQNLQDATSKLQTSECSLMTTKARLQQVQNKNRDLRKRIEQISKGANEMQRTMQAKYDELTNSTQDMQLKADYSTSLQTAISTFLATASDKLCRPITSFDQLLELVTSSPTISADVSSARLKRKNADLKESLKELESATAADYDSQARSIVRLTRQLRQAKRASEQERETLTGEITELKGLMRRSSHAIENLNQKTSQFQRQVVELSDANEQLKAENEQLKRTRQELQSQPDPLVAQLKKQNDVLSAQNESLRDDMKKMQRDRLAIEKEFKKLAHKSEDSVESRKATLDELNQKRAEIATLQHRNSATAARVSELELETFTLTSERQVVKDKLVLSESRVQELESKERQRDSDHQQALAVVNTLEKLMRSQKVDLNEALQARDSLAQKVIEQQALLVKEESLLEREIDKNRVLTAKLREKSQKRARPPEPPEYFVLGYLKHYLLGGLSTELHDQFAEILENSSVPVGERVTQVLNCLKRELAKRPKGMDVGRDTQILPLVTEWLGQLIDFHANDESLVRDMCDLIKKVDSPADAPQNTERVIADIARDNQDALQLLLFLVLTNSDQCQQLQKLKDRMKRDVQSVTEMIRVLGCDNLDGVEQRVNELKENLNREKQRVHELKKIGLALKAQIEANESEIEGYRRKEIRFTQTTAEIETLRKSNGDLTREVARLSPFQQKLRASDKEKERLAAELQRSQAEIEQLKDTLAQRAELAQLPQTSAPDQLTADVTSQLRQAQNQNRSMMREYKRRFAEYEKAVSDLATKLQNATTEAENARIQLCQLKLEKQDLEYRLATESQHKNCFAQMIQAELLHK
jgi:chromosome segregation ATPase